MFFSFKNRTPKQFNFKPVYFEREEEEKEKEKEFSLRGKNYSKDMYDRYDKIPYSELEKRGKRKLKILFGAFASASYALYHYYENILEFFNGIE